jgi:ArsR family transcriptional regulator, arsenate/arsenite/antimonite-responsive transcriptional repressor
MMNSSQPASRSQDEAIRLFQDCTPLFNALGDPVRQQLILLLAQAERLNVGQLAAGSPMSRPTISHHLKILRQAGIVKAEKAGTEQFYSLTLEDLVGKLKQLVQVVENECTAD